MPDHNHGRTGVGDARRPCTSPGNVKSVVSQRPGLRKIAELAIHDRLLKIFRDEAPFPLRRQRSPGQTCISRADSRSETISDGVSRSEPGGPPALPATPPQVRLPGA